MIRAYSHHLPMPTRLKPSSVYIGEPPLLYVQKDGASQSNPACIESCMKQCCAGFGGHTVGIRACSSGMSTHFAESQRSVGTYMSLTGSTAQDALLYSFTMVVEPTLIEESNRDYTFSPTSSFSLTSLR